MIVLRCKNNGADTLRSHVFILVGGAGACPGSADFMPMLIIVICINSGLGQAPVVPLHIFPILDARIPL